MYVIMPSPAEQHVNLQLEGKDNHSQDDHNHSNDDEQGD